MGSSALERERKDSREMCPLADSEGVARAVRPAGGGSESLRIKLLGGFQISIGTRTIEEGAWRLRKAASLVKLLALTPGHRLHREQVMEALWPELGIKAASNNLRGALYAARKALASDPTKASRYLESQDESLVLWPGGQLWVDVGAFEQAATTARRSREPAAYEAALELYAGELLPGDRYEEWAEEHRRRLRETYLSLLLGLANLHEERMEYEPAIEVLRRVLSDEPAREEAHAGLMRLYALLGSKGEALAQYSRLEETLSRELGTEPGASSRALREEIAAGRFPPKDARSLSSVPEESPGTGKHNLPAPRTSFVGREREMVEVKRELAMTRLLTLTGAGGSGKTRLALEVARDLVGAYPDGVWLVEIAGLPEGELIPQAVAGALSIKEQPSQPLLDTFVEELRPKQMLLILDNCEHLVEAAARLVDVLLDSCPRLRVLATSREVLGVAGEVNRLVPSLSVPDPWQQPTVEELERYESVRLFVERARYRNPAFALSPQNMQSVARICERLEGIPLAIELAAARVGLSVEQIAARLDDSLRLLTTGSRTAAPRQRTLRGALDWSYNLLSEPERVLFGRLSVFAGGWTLEAIEAVGAGEGIEEEEVLDVLLRLVDKSLVVTQATEEGGVRYRMLEPVRQYAREKLGEGGEAEEIKRRHAAFFLALAEDAETTRLWGPEQATWFERLEAEHDNLRAALSWAIERGEAELGLCLAGALWWFWTMRGHASEGRAWLERVLAKDGQPSAVARAKALHAVGWLANDQADIDRMAAAAEEGLKLSAEAGVEASVASYSITASFRRMLGVTAELRGEYERASRLYEESLGLCREAGDRRGIAWSLYNLGNVSIHRGDHERATQFLEEGSALCRESADAGMLPLFLLSLGYEYLLEGDHERATALNEEGLTLYREQGHKGGSHPALNYLGWAALVRGDHHRAEALHKESLALSRELGDKLTAAESLDGLACAAGVRLEAERAARLFGAAWALRQAVGYQHTPRESALREPYLAAARSLLEEASWQAAFAEGKTLTLDEAVEYALSEEEPATVSSLAPEQPSAGARPPTLTRREKEVAALVAQGYTNGQIAKELFISERTVDHHVEKILKKLNLRSREQVASRLAHQ